MPVRTFFCYEHEDELLLNKLKLIGCLESDEEYPSWNVVHVKFSFL